jgi:hypothetical protein
MDTVTLPVATKLIGDFSILLEIMTQGPVLQGGVLTLLAQHVQFMLVIWSLFPWRIPLIYTILVNSFSFYLFHLFYFLFIYVFWCLPVIDKTFFYCEQN